MDAVRGGGGAEPVLGAQGYNVYPTPTRIVTNALEACETDTAESVVASGSKRSDRGTLITPEGPVGAFLAGQSADARSIGYAENESPTLKAAESGSTRAPTISGPVMAPQDAALSARLDDEGYVPAVPWDAKPDSPRYAAMGDAVSVNVVEFVGVRLLHVARELGDHDGPVGFEEVSACGNFR